MERVVTAPSTPRGQQAVVQTIAGRRTVSRASSAPKTVRPTITASVVRDPERLQRHIADMQREYDDLFALVQSSAIGGGVLIRGVTMAAGSATLIDHRLGRNTVGWIVTDILAASGGQPRICRTALPTGRSATQFLSLEADKVCTLDVYVF